MSGQSEPWHLDKRVPIALIFTIALQTAAAIWWAANINSRLDFNEVSDASQDSRLQSLEQIVQSQQVAAAGVAAQIGAIRETLDQMRQDQRETNALLRQYFEGKK